MGKLQKKRKITRIRLACNILLLFLSAAITAACAAGIRINRFFEEKTGMTISECYESGRNAVEGSIPSDFRSDRATNIYASDGTKISTIYKNRESSYLDYDEIPVYAVEAFIAVEDRTFWENDGIDPKGIARVIYNYVRTGGEEAHGASTITQQVARNKYLTNEKTISRKVAEIGAAQKLTEMYSKRDIMEFYVNMCCYANGIYGLQDASLYYFGRNADELTLSQTAYLCAIPNRPEYFNPTKNPETPIQRRDKILGDMLEMGFISSHEHATAVNEKIVISIQEDPMEKQYDYETTYAIHCAAKYIMKTDGFEFRYSFRDDSDYDTYQSLYRQAYDNAVDRVYSGGYDICTTIDLEKQKAAQEILDTVLAPMDERLESGTYKVQGAMTVIDNESGKVVAVIGGRKQDGTDGMFSLNRAYQGYAQPGSAIKPLVVYAPAMETTDGGSRPSFLPSSILYNIDVGTAKKLTGKEIAELGGKPVFLRNAVESSLNGCAYWLFNEIGIGRGISHLSDMEFARISPSDYNIGTSLGGLTYGTTTEEMATAYYTLSNGGNYKDADCILSITDKNGYDIYEENAPRRVYEKDAADAMTDIMKGVLVSGTAGRSKWYSVNRTEAAGKTGTTNDNKAAWFCGYTPYYTIAVWVGCDKPETVRNLQGSGLPLDIWKATMLSLTDGLPEASLASLPDGMESMAGCTCDAKCAWETRNESCLACTEARSQDAVNLVCRGREITCTCIVKCEVDILNGTCEACVADTSRCLGVNRDVPCTCTGPCMEGIINTGCPRCARNWVMCQHQVIQEKSCICASNCLFSGLNPGCESCLADMNTCRGALPLPPQTTLPEQEQIPPMETP